MVQQAGNNVVDDNFVEILYDHPNRGDHPVVGPVTGTFYGYRSGGDKFLVDRRDIAGSPHIFKVQDAENVMVKQETPEPPPPPVAMQVRKKYLTEEPVEYQPTTPKPEMIAPAAIKEDQPAEAAESVESTSIVEFTKDSEGNIDVVRGDIESIPGVLPAVAVQLRAQGYVTWRRVAELDEEALMKLDGVGPARAKSIVRYLAEHAGEY